MAYWVIQCNGCGNFRVLMTQDIRKTNYRCFHCHKNTKVKKKNQFGLSLKTSGPYADGRTAQLMCQELSYAFHNKKQGDDKNEKRN